ncbi:MAG: hypothetical protein ABI743_11585 [bacterium]
MRPRLTLLLLTAICFAGVIGSGFAEPVSHTLCLSDTIDQATSLATGDPVRLSDAMDLGGMFILVLPDDPDSWERERILEAINLAHGDERGIVAVFPEARRNPDTTQALLVLNDSLVSVALIGSEAETAFPYAPDQVLLLTVDPDRSWDFEELGIVRS